MRAWYRNLARAIGGDRVVIAFEPDSVGTIDCLARSRRDDRLRLLRYGVDALSRLPGATIYLEAGASDWEPARRTAKKLRKIGISKVRGFMLNVTHYDWTAANIRHGIDLSRRLGGKHFVINTSQNGRGPVHYKAANGRRINIWCNPGMRGLGPAPTTATSHPLVDAYLWINRPGYAQSCQGRKIDWYRPGAHARALRHGLGEPAGGHPLRALQALSAECVRRALSSGACAGTSAPFITSSRRRPTMRCAPPPFSTCARSAATRSPRRPTRRPSSAQSTRSPTHRHACSTRW